MHAHTQKLTRVRVYAFTILDNLSPVQMDEMKCFSLFIYKFVAR